MKYRLHIGDTTEETEPNEGFNNLIDWSIRTMLNMHDDNTHAFQMSSSGLFYENPTAPYYDFSQPAMYGDVVKHKQIDISYISDRAHVCNDAYQFGNFIVNALTRTKIAKEDMVTGNKLKQHFYVLHWDAKLNGYAMFAVWSNNMECKNCESLITPAHMKRHMISSTCGLDSQRPKLEKAQLAEIKDAKLVGSLLRANIKITKVPVKWDQYAPKWAIDAAESYLTSPLKDAMELHEYLAKMAPAKTK